jgi:oligosaccharide repeat unit polymerase
MTHSTTTHATQEIGLADADWLWLPQDAALQPEPLYIPRSPWVALPFLLPILIAGVSYAAGGVSILTDFSFVCLIFLCVTFLLRELYVFPMRFGIGGVLIFAGTLIWFCYDYVKHWMGVNPTTLGFDPRIVAKSAFYHMVFIFLMVVGLRIRWGKFLEKSMQLIPEPPSTNVYFIIVLITFSLGLIPFVFFSQEGILTTMYKSIMGGRGTDAAIFTAGRTGNVNYSWGGYLTQLCDIAMMGSVLGAFHAVIITRSIFQKVVCWGMWLFWLVMSFGTGTRGFVVFMGLPVIMLLFLKYNYIAAAAFRRISVRSYVVCGFIGMVLLIIVQVQGEFRNTGFYDVKASDVDVKELIGNEMFTTTLVGMNIVPDQMPPFADRFPGEGLIRAIPDTIYWFLIGPIPRVLWHNKPVDQVGNWYSDLVTGESNGVEGTTISGGAVGSPYIRWGPFGVIEYGLMYGWMFGVCERSLRRAGGRPMALLMTLAFSTFMFRAFRDLFWHHLYPVIIGGVVMYVFARAFGGVSGRHETHGATGEYAPAA